MLMLVVSDSPPKKPSLLQLSVYLRNGVGSAGDSLAATPALPDSNSRALDGVLAAEGTGVAGVLGDFHLLHLLTQGGTVSIKPVSISKPTGEQICVLVFVCRAFAVAPGRRRREWVRSIPGTIFTGDTDLCSRSLA